jgi:hypothetical protein
MVMQRESLVMGCRVWLERRNWDCWESEEREREQGKAISEKREDAEKRED